MTDLAMGRGGSFDMGRVVERTFGVIGGNFAALFIMALGLTALPEALVGLTVSPESGDVTPLSALGSVLSFVGAMILQAAVTHTSVVDLNGGKATLAASLRVGISNFGPIFGISLLVGLGVILGLLLLIIPGIILAVAWSVAVPVQVMEKRDVTASLSRSAELTRGSRWPIFGLSFIYLAIFLVAALVGGMIFGAIGELTGDSDPLLSRVVFEPMLQAALSLVGASGAAAIYYELRSKKEGVGPQELAAVFD